MAFCPVCGRQLKDGDRFCEGCGRSVEAPGPVPEPAAPPASAEVPAAPIPAQADMTAATAAAQSAAVAAPERKRSMLPVVIASILAFVLIGGGIGAYLIYRAVTDDDKTVEETSTPAYTRQDYIGDLTVVLSEAEALARDINDRSKDQITDLQQALEMADSWADGAASVYAAADALAPPDEVVQTHAEVLVLTRRIAEGLDGLRDFWYLDVAPPAGEEDRVVADLNMAWTSFADLQEVADELGIAVSIPDLTWLAAANDSGNGGESGIIGERGDSEGMTGALDDPALVQAMTDYVVANTSPDAVAGLSLTVYDVIESTEGGIYALGAADLGGDRAWVIMYFERDYWVGADFGTGIDPFDSAPDDVAQIFSDEMGL